jgi:hypothetical protein
VCVYIYIYTLFYVQPEHGSEEPKHVAESCKLKKLIKVVLEYILLPYLITKQNGDALPKNYKCVHNYF